MPACLSCGTENAPGAKFCSECGAELAAPTPGREVRKTVTVLFCDVTGSTELGERLDPESLRSVMGEYFDRMQRVLEAHGGTVEKFIGDAVMAVFGIPVVHEDDALRAVRAAAGMRETLEELNADLQLRWGLRLRARIGVNTGEVVTGDPAGGKTLVTGDTVNTAARFEQAAQPDEILIGEDTYRLSRDAVRADPVDPLALKGKAELVGAYRVLDVRPGAPGRARRGDPPMVGRERPLRLLEDAFDSAVADRTSYLFTVLGTAGIGKSRLALEFLNSIDGAARVLRGRCLSYGEGITFWPITEMVTEAAGVVETDGPEEARAKVHALVGALPDGDQVAAHLATLIGLEVGPAEPPWAVRRLFASLASGGPVVAVFDDIHWAEPALLDLIEHVAEWSRDLPILLLCLARPEFLEGRAGWGGGRLHAGSVQLEPLRDQESDELIGHLLATQGGPAGEVLSRIAGQTCPSTSTVGSHCGSESSCRAQSSPPAS